MMADITNHPFTSREDAKIQKTIDQGSSIPYLKGHSSPHVKARCDAMRLSRTQVRRLRAWIALGRDEEWIARALGFPNRVLVVSESCHYWHKRPEPNNGSLIVGTHDAMDGMCPKFPKFELDLYKHGVYKPWCVCQSAFSWSQEEKDEAERAARSGLDECQLAATLHRRLGTVQAQVKRAKQYIEATSQLNLPGLAQDDADQLVKLVRQGYTVQECVSKIGYGVLLIQKHYDTVKKYLASNPQTIKKEPAIK